MNVLCKRRVFEEWVVDENQKLAARPDQVEVKHG